MNVALRSTDAGDPRSEEQRARLRPFGRKLFYFVVGLVTFSIAYIIFYAKFLKDTE